jgi:hypothetical protein
MKLSVEAKVAAAITAGFICVTVGAIAQAGSGGQTDLPNNYSSIDNPGVNNHMSEQTYNALLPPRTKAKEKRQNFPDSDATAVTANKSTKSKTTNSRNHHTGTTQIRGARTKQSGY